MGVELPGLGDVLNPGASASSSSSSSDHETTRLLKPLFDPEESKENRRQDFMESSRSSREALLATRRNVPTRPGPSSSLAALFENPSEVEEIPSLSVALERREDSASASVPLDRATIEARFSQIDDPVSDE